MKKTVAVAICKLYNELYADSTEETRTRAEIREPYKKMYRATSWEVDIVPTAKNDGSAFYATHECVDLCRAFHVSFYVTHETNEEGDSILVGIFY